MEVKNCVNKNDAVFMLFKCTARNRIDITEYFIMKIIVYIL